MRKTYIHRRRPAFKLWKERRPTLFDIFSQDDACGVLSWNGEKTIKFVRTQRQGRCLNSSVAELSWGPELALVERGQFQYLFVSNAWNRQTLWALNGMQSLCTWNGWQFTKLQLGRNSNIWIGWESSREILGYFRWHLEIGWVGKPEEIETAAVRYPRSQLPQLEQSNRIMTLDVTLGWQYAFDNAFVTIAVTRLVRHGAPEQSRNSSSNVVQLTR